MPYANDPATTGDLEKLQIAFREILQKFGSVDDILEAFGLAEMPLAQRYGILFGCIVFTCTISTVIGLLIFGGSFRRIAEQAQTGDATILSPGEARSKRALLLEQLLEGRERMAQRYQEPPTTDKATPLTHMLLNEAPDPVADENTTPTKDKKTKGGDKKKQRYIPPFYEENYIQSYRRCQDKPGGAYDGCILVASCGKMNIYSSLSLRNRSYLTLRYRLFKFFVSWLG